MKFLIIAVALLVAAPTVAEVNIGTVTIDGKEITLDDTDRTDSSRHDQCSEEGCKLYPMPRIIIDTRIEQGTQPNRVPGKKNIVRPRH